MGRGAWWRQRVRYDWATDHSKTTTFRKRKQKEPFLTRSVHLMSLALFSIPKPDDKTTRKLQMHISCECRCNHLEQDICRSDAIMYKKSILQSLQHSVFLPLCFGFCCSLCFALYTFLFPTAQPIHPGNLTSSFGTDPRPVHLRIPSCQRHSGRLSNLYVCH